MLLNIIKKSKVSWTNFRDKLQFVNSVKRLVSDLTKIPFLKCLISIYRLIDEVLNDQHLFTESNLGFRVMSSFIQVVVSQNELQLFSRAEKLITLIIGRIQLDCFDMSAYSQCALCNKTWVKFRKAFFLLTVAYEQRYDE